MKDGREWKKENEMGDVWTLSARWETRARAGGSHVTAQLFELQGSDGGVVNNATRQAGTADPWTWKEVDECSAGQEDQEGTYCRNEGKKPPQLPLAQYDAHT